MGSGHEVVSSEVEGKVGMVWIQEEEEEGQLKMEEVTLG